MRWQLVAAIATGVSLAIYCVGVGAGAAESAVAVLVVTGIVLVPAVAVSNRRGFIVADAILAALLAAGALVTIAVGSVALLVPLAAVAFALARAGRDRS
jgi:hypothetical protein